MRSIEQLWCPQIHYAIKKYYSARAKMVDSSYQFCSGYLSIELTGSPKEEGGSKWKGRDILCKCEPSWFWQVVVGSGLWLNSVRWEVYLPFVVNVRNGLAAVEKARQYA
jgi:hypothetical protein